MEMKLPFQNSTHMVLSIGKTNIQPREKGEWGTENISSSNGQSTPPRRKRRWCTNSTHRSLTARTETHTKAWQFMYKSLNFACDAPPRCGSILWLYVDALYIFQRSVLNQTKMETERSRAHDANGKPILGMIGPEKAVHPIRFHPHRRAFSSPLLCIILLWRVPSYRQFVSEITTHP